MGYFIQAYRCGCTTIEFRKVWSLGLATCDDLQCAARTFIERANREHQEELALRKRTRKAAKNN